jgi:hypothetical protein
VDKRVQCEKCRASYFYRLERTVHAFTPVPVLTMMLTLAATPFLLFWASPIKPFGGGFLIRLGGRSATPALPSIGKTKEVGDEETVGAVHHKLRRALLHGVELVACPQCGWYQKSMVSEARDRVLPAFFWIAFAVLVVSQFTAAVIVYRGIGEQKFDGLTRWIICSGVGIGLAAVIMGVRFLLALRANPNARYPERIVADSEAPAGVLEKDWFAQLGAGAVALRQATTIPRPGKIAAVPPPPARRNS